MTRWTAALLVGSLGFALVGLPRSANAQARGYVLLGGGLAIPVGDFHDQGAKTGWLGQIAGGITAPGGILGGRVNGTFSRNGFSGSDEHFRIIGAMGDVVVSPKMTGNIAPYVLGGVGFQNGKATGTGITDNGLTKFAWNAGAGIGFRAGSIGVFVEGRFLSIRVPGAAQNLIPISAGIRWGGH